MKEAVTAKNKNGQKEEKKLNINKPHSSLDDILLLSYILALVSCYRSTTECCATIVRENKMAGRVVTILKILAQLKGLQ